MKMRDVRICFNTVHGTNNHIHLMEADVTYLPNCDNPTHVKISSGLFDITLLYHTIECIVANWHQTEANWNKKRA